MNAPRHVFELGWDVWAALSPDEISASVAAMHEFGIYRLPYDAGEIVLRIQHHDDGDPKGFHQVTEVKGLREGDIYREEILMYPKTLKGSHGLRDYHKFIKLIQAREGRPVTRWLDPEFRMIDLGPHLDGKRVVHRYQAFCEAADDVACQKHFRDGLIVLLASKGLDKQTKERKLAKLGIGKKTNEYITTIGLSHNLERHESARDGSPVRPHLRRGHVRMQPHGPANSLRKAIWVEPCFVNADADFVSQRTAYRVRH